MDPRRADESRSGPRHAGLESGGRGPQGLRRLSPEGEHVFQWKGKPVDDCNGHAFKNAAERAGLPDLRWHDLRHTWASWAVQSGVTLQELMQLGGWSGYTMVLRYAHLAPDLLAAAAERVTETPHKKRHTEKRDRQKGRKSLNFGGKGGTRTLDPGIMSAAPYRLSRITARFSITSL